MTNDAPQKPQDDDLQQEHFGAALNHISQALNSGNIAVSAAKGILFSLTETLGVLVGDPDLPAHVKSGYEGLLETARELSVQLNKPKK
ncbi:hypothetical protein PATSB16_23720 [Pandoraea thiooxydans]|uniref:Major surface protein 3 n=1 Tax=Pandoraea thiooxydans TaxID=445709 RepID=A0A0G3EWU7_9BURK|nr:hypothetical protein [Pandoraea thiooxydans]AKJ70479.1 hypothetical protein ABW99_09210 [Pandoraea thiooxydans]APR95712.1 hypothetical protein PATSB16_23720 [Pandoraea thiooxydans]MBU6492958.1 hypothetical protein [Burkholderiales bacterium]MDE2608289.1 hypothetical protein [Burkholderiales bacterium]